MPSTLSQCWEKAFNGLPEVKRSMFKENIRVICGENEITVIFLYKFTQQQFETDCLAAITLELNRLTGKKIGVVLKIDSIVEKAAGVPVSDSKAQAPAAKPLSLIREPAYTLKPRSDYTLDRFVVGESNRDAFEAALALAKGQINTVLVTGRIGLGKSHALEGARWLAKKTYPEATVLNCVPAKALLAEFTRLTREKNQALWEVFNKKNSSAGWLFFDDLHQLAVGEGGTQRELKTIIESVLARGAFIMLTSLRPLRELEQILVDQELISRLRGFLTVEIKPPDFDLKVAILLKKAGEEPTPFELDVELAREIARRVTVPDVRPLVGIVSSLKLRVGRRAVVDSELINELLGEVPQKKLDPETITKIVAEHFDVSVEAIKSDNKMALVVRARRVAFYLCRKLLPQVSTTELGKHFKKDHSTVIQGANDIEREKSVNAGLAAELLIIEGKFSL